MRITPLSSTRTTRSEPSASPPRWAIVTGASSGIGLGVARELARRGWGTMLLARRGGLLDAAAAELRRFAPSLPMVVDLADPADVARIAEIASRAEGSIEALINNAGVGLYRPFAGQSMEDHRRLMQVNHFAAITLIQAVLPTMLARRRGVVINVASNSAKMGPWGHSAYAASKAALRALTECLEAEHASSGVRFSCVFPGIVATEYFRKNGSESLYRTVAKRAIPVARCARAICDAIERPRVWVTVPWHYRLLDVISAVSPAWAHALVARESRPRSVRAGAVVAGGAGEARDERE